MENKNTFKHLSFTQRLQLENMLKLKISKRVIADTLGVHISTIYREIKRGSYDKKVQVFDYYEKVYTYKTAYSPDIAQSKYNDHLKEKGSSLKIGKDFEFASYIEKRIVEDGLTPLSVIGEIKRNKMPFKTSICVNTLYNYIYKGVFLRLSMEHLTFKKKEKRTKRHLTISRAPKGTSIEQRPVDILQRNTFGHWEMDCVCGPKGSNVLLVLTERLTRKEIIYLMKNQKSESVIKCLNNLENKYGLMFSKIFKTITVDNGSEFSDFQKMEYSKKYKKKRTTIYYCHPYCSSERGSNERMNREIRRKYPKGTNFKKVKSSDIVELECWLNNYPRQVLDFNTPDNLFNYYVHQLN